MEQFTANFVVHRITFCSCPFLRRICLRRSVKYQASLIYFYTVAVLASVVRAGSTGSTGGGSAAGAAAGRPARLRLPLVCAAAAPSGAGGASEPTSTPGSGSSDPPAAAAANEDDEDDEDDAAVAALEVFCFLANECASRYASSVPPDSAALASANLPTRANRCQGATPQSHRLGERMAYPRLSRRLK